MQRLFRAFYSKGVSHWPLHFGKDLKTFRRARKLYSGNKGGAGVGGFRYARIGGCWHGETIGKLMRSRVGFFWTIQGWKKMTKIREAVS